jgi:hypothetical protein
MGLVNQSRLRRILTRMLDENEFLSPYGIRSLSRHHAEHPYVFSAQGQEYGVSYLPAESDSGMFGGNSNWRGPIWMPRRRNQGRSSEAPARLYCTAGVLRRPAWRPLSLSCRFGIAGYPPRPRRIIMLLFSIADAGTMGSAPVVTIPANQ